jgi:hypothetical protein
MSNSIVALVYLLSVVAAVYLLWRFSHVRWYWHALAAAAALIIGFMPPLTAEATAVYDMLIGAAFLLLIAWGLGELAFKAFHIHRHI